MHRLPLILILGASALPLAAQNARTPQQLDLSTTGIGLGPGVASDGNLTVATWNDGSTGGSNVVNCSVSDANGVAWGPEVRVDTDATFAAKFTGYQNGHPTTFVHEPNIYVTWRDDRGGSAASDIYFNRSTDGGISFEASDIRLDSGFPPGSNDLRDWSMAVSRGATPASDSIFVLISVDNGPEELYLVHSFDGGATWSSAVGVSTANGSGADVDDISVAASGLWVLCAWADDRNGQNDLWVRSSTDGGVTFGPEMMLDASGPAAGNVVDSIACEVSAGQFGVVAWGEENGGSTQDELHVAVTQDTGVTFTPDFLLGGYTPGTDDIDAVAVALSGGNTLVAWDDNRTGTDSVYRAFSSDYGLTWSADLQVSPAGASFARFGGSSPDVCMIFTGGSFPNPVESAWSSDDGVTFTSVGALDGTAGADADFAEVAYNATNQSVIGVWLGDNLGSNRVFAGGYSFCGASSMTSRNAGSNPASLTATSSPQLAGTWTATVDLSTTGHSLAGLVGYGSPLNLPLAGGQVLLTNVADPTGEIFGFAVQAGPLATFTAAVPEEPALCGFSLSAQAVHIGGVTPFALSNALDLVLAGI